MNNKLNELLNKILSKTWNVESIINEFNAMVETLQLKESNPTPVKQLMKNKQHVEELVSKISQRFNQLGMKLKSFDELEKLISNYYEEN